MVRMPRIDLFRHIVDPVRGETGDFYNAGVKGPAVDLVDNRSEPVHSSHRRGIHRRPDQICRSRRPEVTRAVTQKLARPVKMTAGDQGYRTAPHHFH